MGERKDPRLFISCNVPLPNREQAKLQKKKPEILAELGTVWLKLIPTGFFAQRKFLSPNIFPRKVDDMNFIEISKALSNETRVKILGWLKNPHVHFPPQREGLGTPVDLRGGVCVSSIQEKAGVHRQPSRITLPCCRMLAC